MPGGEDKPIHIAAKAGDLAALQKLIKHRANVNARGKWQYTPLMHAVTSPHALDTVRLLIASGADVTLENSSHENVLGRAVAEKNIDPEVIGLLFDANPHAVEAKVDYPLIHRAASWGSATTVALLLGKYPQWLSLRWQNKTPMDLAIERRNHTVVKVLLEHGAAPDSRDQSGFGKTLLQYAVEAEDIDLVAAVISRLREKSGDGVLNDTGSLALAAAQGQTVMVKTLLACGIPIDDRDFGSGQTALMSAAGHGRHEIMMELLAGGAAVNARDKKNSTALMYAASSGNTEALRILVAAGAEIAAINDFGWNALMQAAHRGFAPAAEYLLDAGLPLNAVDTERGYTALTLAQKTGALPVADLLESRGARERPVRWRQSGEPRFLITECDICAYLPHKVELTHSYEPEDFPGLEIIYKESSSDYKADETEMIRRCVNCGTCYRHYHYIDTEDSIGGAGPVCNHYFIRYNLLWLKQTLTRLGKTTDLAEADQDYPKVIAAFNKSVMHRATIKPHVYPHVIESLVDFFISQEKVEELHKLLGDQADIHLAHSVRADLDAILAEQDLTNEYPSVYRRRNFLPEIRMQLQMLIRTGRLQY